MRKITNEMEKKITYDRIFRKISYRDIASMYSLSKSGVCLIIHRFCGKVYSDYIASDKNYDYICNKYQFSKSSAKEILSTAERLYRVGYCYSNI